MAHTLSLKLPSTACSPSALRGSHHAEDPSVLASGNGLGYESSSLPISSRRFNFVCSSGALHAASSSANLRLRVESSFCCLTLDSRNLEVTLAFRHSFFSRVLPCQPTLPRACPVSRARPGFRDLPAVSQIQRPS